MAIDIDDQQVVKRVTVTLEDDIHAALTQWADEDARTVPNLLAWLAMKALREREEIKDSRSQPTSK